MWGQHGDNVGTTGMLRPCGDNMETTWGQHDDNVETTWGQHWGPQGCGDHIGTTWRQHEDNMGMWRPCGDRWMGGWMGQWLGPGQTLNIE